MISLYRSSTYTGDLGKAASHSLGLSKLAGSTVLVTGASGLLGSFAVDTLVYASSEMGLGLRVMASGRSEERLRKRFAECPFSGLELLALDVTDRPPVGLQVDYVIHAASNAHPGAFVGDPVGTIMSNVVGLAHLAELCLPRGARLLFVSSGEVYGQSEGQVAMYDEGFTGHVELLSSRSAYPMGKRAAETLLASYVVQHDLDAVIVRPCHTYGPTATEADTRANASFMQDALVGRNIVLNSAGSQVRSYSYVADAVSGLLTVLVRGARGEAYNLANPDVRVSIAEFAEVVAGCAGVRVERREPTNAEQALASPVPRQVLDSAKLENLGWAPSYSLSQGIANTLKVMEETHA